MTKQILLVEDNDEFREILAYLLEKEGFSVIQTANGKQALEILKQDNGRKHFLITDLEMPWLGGEGLVLQALKDGLEFKHIVVMSSSRPGQALQELANKGSLEVLQKPFDMELLLKIVRTKTV